MIIPNSVFIDTNVLVYAKLGQSPFYQTAVDQLRTLDEQGAVLWVSRQILREYLAAMTKPGVLTSGIPLPSLTADVRYFSSRFQVAEDGSAVMDRLLHLVEHVTVGGRQIHDANIVATMQAYGIHHLLTHNAADFARFASWITVMPLVTPPHQS